MANQVSEGIKLALITALISGVSIFINKFAVDAIKPPLVFTAVKNFGVGLLILSVILSTTQVKSLKNLTKKQFINLLVIGIVGGAVPFYLFFTGLSQISAINGALIHKTLVLWVALLAVPLLKEHLSKKQAVGIFILFTSNLVVGGFKGFSFSQGELFVLLATLFWAVETIIAKKALENISADVLTLFRMGVGSLILLAVSAFIAPQGLAAVFDLTGKQAFWLAATMLTLFGYVFTWYKALKIAPATTVTAVLVLSTLVTNILTALFVTYKWNIPMLLPQLLLALVGLGIYFGVGKKATVK